MTTYRRIAAVQTTLVILKHLAHQKEPATGKEIATAVDQPDGTVMCHLVTLEDAGFVRRIGDRYEIGMEAALLWARKKALLEGERARTDHDLERLENGGK